MLKLGDFGLSKFVVNLSDETGLTADGLGTSLYLSPEQVIHVKLEKFRKFT